MWYPVAMRGSVSAKDGRAGNAKEPASPRAFLDSCKYPPPDFDCRSSACHTAFCSCNQMPFLMAQKSDKGLFHSTDVHSAELEAECLGSNE